MAQVGVEVPLDEALEQAGHAVGGDRVHADDDQREGPAADAEKVQHRVEAGQEQEAPAAAEEDPARRPDPLDHRADAQRAQALARRQPTQARGDEPERPSPSASRARFRTPPASRPRIIVPSVGMKLSVA